MFERSDKVYSEDVTCLCFYKFPNRVLVFTFLKRCRQKDDGEDDEASHEEHLCLAEVLTNLTRILSTV